MNPTTRARIGVLWILLAAMFPACETGETRSWAIRGGQWVDVVAGGAIDNGTIVIRDGVITEILAPGAPVPGGLPVVDATEAMILPGLWDNHAHLLEQDENGSHGAVPTLWEIYRGTPYKRNAYLDSGVTSVRDPGGGFDSVDYRDRAARGEFESPHIFSGGKFFTAVEGHPFSTIEPGILAPFAGYQTNDPGEARRFVSASSKRGVDFIHTIYTSAVLKSGEYPATGPSIGGLPDEWLEDVPILRPEVLTAITDEAGRRGLAVSAHVNRWDEAQDAVLAGATYLEHSWEIPDDAAGAAFIDLLVTEGVCWDPTLVVFGTRAPELLPSHFEAVLRAWNAGVKITTGTDAGLDGADAPFGAALLLELGFLQDAGLPRIDVLRAATLTSAQCLGADGITGSIEIGKRADLIVVRGDPLTDIDALSADNIRGVFVDGRRVRWRD